ncbi:hypothetical protein [Methanococcus maripaludis]|jgi:uncharacterized protein YwgA|uniref:Uncharacterized protein n=2 Tax=Methanococcus maripaludis TaxID=39152 RepID=A0A8T3VUJ4_METMI|nr:hypothetical protein [Methanococcus maripaludis]AEK19747.1 hypothetical protein GYY_04360 [Methanococcus maripaludis X1]MBG0768318.1 hypothetical protein [Methanococcus maripaludis]
MGVIDLKELEILEQYVIILLGVGDSPVPSKTHLQKEFFILQKAAPKLSKIVNFKKHYFGPYSEEIDDILENPICCDGAIITENNKIMLSEIGQKEYENLVNLYGKNEKFKELLNVAKLIRKMYDKLNNEELLLLIYLTYGEYTENSVVAEKILEPVKRVSIAKNLYRKGLISDERLHEIIGGD